MILLFTRLTQMRKVVVAFSVCVKRITFQEMFSKSNKVDFEN